jgi:hypothetical protein
MLQYRTEIQDAGADAGGIILMLMLSYGSITASSRAINAY